MGSFLRYFLRYVSSARTRQGLLFLALFGLFLSALALTVVQGIMGGLQRGLVARSKSYHGVGVVRFSDEGLEAQWWEKVRARGFKLSREVEAEVLVRHGTQLSAVRLHGIDLLAPRPPFLEHKELEGAVLGSELAQRLKASFFSDLRFIAPQASDSLMGEVPRQLSLAVSDYLSSEVSELDAHHAWVRIGFVQNLLRRRGVELWRVFDPADWQELRRLLAGEDALRFTSWEEQNRTLVWALGLETTVMLALFTAMALLVALAITTGLVLFFAKIRTDLASFWLLGLSLRRIERLVLAFILQLSCATCVVGVGLGVAALKVLERFGHRLMPDIFVERGFPVDINLRMLSLAFLVPFVISVVFSMFSFFQFRRDNPRFIQLVRGSSEGA